MNTWYQQQEQEQELHESFVNWLYECKPVKTFKRTPFILKHDELNYGSKYQSNTFDL